MGAKAIGIDIVFDSPRPDDDLLKTQLRAMRTPTWLAYAEHGSNPAAIQYAQQRFLEGFLAAVTTAQTRPASVFFPPDPEGDISNLPPRPKGRHPLITPHSIRAG